MSVEIMLSARIAVGAGQIVVELLSGLLLLFRCCFISCNCVCNAPDGTMLGVGAHELSKETTRRIG